MTMMLKALLKGDRTSYFPLILPSATYKWLKGVLSVTRWIGPDIAFVLLYGGSCPSFLLLSSQS
jgi:hypothetical protein